MFNKISGVFIIMFYGVLSSFYLLADERISIDIAKNVRFPFISLSHGDKFFALKDGVTEAVSTGNMNAVKNAISKIEDGRKNFASLYCKLLGYDEASSFEVVDVPFEFPHGFTRVMLVGNSEEVIRESLGAYLGTINRPEDELLAFKNLSLLQIIEQYGPASREPDIWNGFNNSYKENPDLTLKHLKLEVFQEEPLAMLQFRPSNVFSLLTYEEFLRDRESGGTATAHPQEVFSSLICEGTSLNVLSARTSRIFEKRDLTTLLVQRADLLSSLLITALEDSRSKNVEPIEVLMARFHSTFKNTPLDPLKQFEQFIYD